MRNREFDRKIEKLSAPSQAECGTGRIGAASSVLRKLLIPFLRRPGSSLLAALLGIAAALFNLSRPVLLGWAVGNLTSDPESGGWRIAVGFLLLSWICTWLVSYALERISTRAEQNALLDFRLELFTHLLRLPREQSERIPPGRLEAYSLTDLPRRIG